MKTRLPSLARSLAIAVVLLSACERKANPTDPKSNAAAQTSDVAAATLAAATMPPGASPTTAQAMAAPSTDQGRVVEMTGNDLMKYSVSEIRVKAGESVTVRLRNTGTVPKSAMGHNFVLLKSAEGVPAFIAAAQQSAATEHVPTDRKGQIVAATKMLGPGETDSITFRAPEERGSYPYVCTFPGHFQVGMQGLLVVE